MKCRSGRQEEQPEVGNECAQGLSWAHYKDGEDGQPLIVSERISKFRQRPRSVVISIEISIQQLVNSSVFLARKWGH